MPKKQNRWVQTEGIPNSKQDIRSRDEDTEIADEDTQMTHSSYICLKLLLEGKNREIFKEGSI